MIDDEIRARASISNTLAIVAQAGDARKAEVYASCFTENGVLQLDQAIMGRDAIREWMLAPSVIRQPNDRPAGFVSHHLTTCRIEITGEVTATVRTYWLVTGPGGLDHNGYYDDRFRKDGDEWLIEHRRPRTLWIAENSLLRG